MAVVRTMQDKDGNIVYPQTILEAVYNQNNVDLKTLLGQMYTKAEVDALIAALQAEIDKLKQ